MLCCIRGVIELNPKLFKRSSFLMNMAKDVELWLNCLYKLKQSFTSPILLFLYLIQYSERRPMSHQNINFSFIFFNYWVSFRFSITKLPIKILRPMIYSQYRKAINFHHLKLQKMTDFLKLFYLFFYLRLTKVVFEVISIKDKIVIAGNDDLMFNRNILYEFPKAFQLFSFAFHGKISCVDKQISCWKRFYIDFLVHAMSVRKSQDFEFFHQLYKVDIIMRGRFTYKIKFVDAD